MTKRWWREQTDHDAGPHVMAFRGGDIPRALLPALLRIHQTFHVPTEAVVREPEQIAPAVGRTYATNFFLKDRRIVQYAQLCRRKDFVGTMCEKELFLVELFADRGEDGHVAYEIEGHALMTQTQIDRYLAERGFRRRTPPLRTASAP